MAAPTQDLPELSELVDTMRRLIEAGDASAELDMALPEATLASPAWHAWSQAYEAQRAMLARIDRILSPEASR